MYSVYDTVCAYICYECPLMQVFVSSGLGGMSGAQPKAATIVGCIAVIAEVNVAALLKRHQQGWVWGGVG